MENGKLSTKLLFDEIKNAHNKNSDILEINFELEFENNNPKIFSIIEDENWGTLNVFFKVKNQNIYYIINVENSELNEVINGYYYAKYQISLNVISTKNIDNLVNSFKIKPQYKYDYSYPSNLEIENSLKSTISFAFDLKPDFLQNQIFEFLDVMDTDKINFQELLIDNYGVLSIGIPKNNIFEDYNPLPVINNKLIKRLSEYNLSIQFGEIINN